MKFKDVSDIQLTYSLSKSKVNVKRKNSFYNAITKVIVLFFLPIALSIFDWGITASSSNSILVSNAFAQTVNTNDIVNRAVTTPKLAPRSVGRNKIKNGAITSNKIRNGTIQSQDLDPTIDAAISGNTATNATQQTTIDANTAASTANTNTNATQQTTIDANTSEISALDIENADQQLQIDNQQNDVTQLQLDTTDQQIEIDANTTTNTAQQITINANTTASSANTTTNGTQQLAIDANTTLLATHDDTFNFISTINNSQQITINSNTSSLSSLTTTVSNSETLIADLQQQILTLQSNSSDDSADGVYITFAQETELNNQRILDINGLGLFQSQGVFPFTFIGNEHDSSNTTLSISAQNTIPNSTLQQVIAELPSEILEGTHRLTLSNPQGKSEFDVKIAAGDQSPTGLWVATGLNGEIGYSSDGVNWTLTQNNGFGTTKINDVVYGAEDGLWVAIGQDGKIGTSPDGINWDQQTSPIPNGATGNWVVYGNGTYLISTINGGQYYSLDGITWTATDPSGSAYHGNIVFGNGKFILNTYHNGTIYTSSDAINWSQHGNFGTNSGSYGGSYGNGLYLIGVDGGLRNSTDGVNWSGQISIGTTVPAIAYGNGRWAIGSYGSNGLYYSNNGSSFTAATHDITAGRIYIYGIDFGNGLFVAGGADDTNSTSRIATSTDGITWTQVSNPFTGFIRSVAFNN